MMPQRTLFLCLLSALSLVLVSGSVYTDEDDRPGVVTLSLPSEGCFYPGATSSITWTSNFTATIGGASISLDCGTSGTVVEPRMPLYSTTGVFTVVGGSTLTENGTRCLAYISGSQADQYQHVHGSDYIYDYFASTPEVPVRAQSLSTGLSPSSSASSPIQAIVGLTQTITITPPYLAPSTDMENATVVIDFACTDLASVSPSAVTITTGGSDVTYTVTFGQAGFVRCTHTSTSPAISAIASTYFRAFDVTPLSITYPAHFYQTSTTEPTTGGYVYVANPYATSALRPSGLTVGIQTCTITDGISVQYQSGGSSSTSGAVTFSSSSAPQGSWSFKLLTISAYQGNTITCTISPLTGDDADYFTITTSTFSFTVGTQLQFNATADATTVLTKIGTATITLTPPANVVIDTDVSITPVCSQSGVADVTYSTLTFTSAVAQTWVYTASSTVGIVNCSYTISGTDQYHFLPIPNTIFNQTDYTIAVSNVPVTGTDATLGSNSKSTIFTIDVTNPVLSNGSVTATLACTGTTSVVAITDGTQSDGGVVASGASLTFGASSSWHPSGRFNLTVAPISWAFKHVNCSWTLSGTVYKAVATMEPFSFYVGTVQELSMGATAASPATVYMNAVSTQIITTSGGGTAVIGGSFTITSNCVTCGNTGAGYGVTSASDRTANDVLTVTGTYPDGVTGSRFYFWPTAAGIVTCSFTVGGTDAAHFQVDDAVFNVIGQHFDITISNNITAPTGILDVDETVYTSTAIPPTGEDLDVVVRVASPFLLVSLNLTCITTAPLASLDLTPVAAGSLNAVGNSLSWNTVTSTAGTFTIAIPANASASGIRVTCAFSHAGTQTTRIYTPNGFSFYVGPSDVQLDVAYRQIDPLFPGDASADITISSPSVSSTQGFTLPVTCTGFTDDDVVEYCINQACDTLTVDGFDLEFAAGNTTQATFNIMPPSHFTGSAIVCSYSTITGIDYQHFLSPTVITTLNMAQPINWTIGGTASGDAVIPSGGLATLTVALSSPITSSDLVVAVYVLCSYAIAGSVSTFVGVSPSAFEFDASVGTNATTYVISTPTTGTDTTNAAETFTCQFSLSPNGSNQTSVAAFIHDIYFTLGNQSTFTITVPDTTIYANLFENTAYYTGFYMVPSTMPATGAFTINSTCALGGTITFSVGYTRQVQIEAFNENYEFQYVPPVPTSDSQLIFGQETCTFAINELANIAFTVPAPLVINVVDRASLLMNASGFDSSLGAGTVVTGTIALSDGSVNTDGVTVIITCTSDSGTLITAAPYAFYFFPGEATAQAITFTTGDQFNYGSCTASTEVYGDTLSDLSSNSFSPVTLTGGIAYTFDVSVPDNGWVGTCSSTTIVVTMPAAMWYGLTLDVTCLGVAFSVSSTLTIKAGSSSATLTYDSGSESGFDVCTFSVDTSSSYYDDLQRINQTFTQSTTITIGTPGSFTVDIDTTVLPADTTANITMQPSMAAATGVTVTPSASNGTISPASFTFYDVVPASFVLTAPDLADGSCINIVVTYTLSDYGFATPESSTFVACGPLVLATALSPTDSIVSGQTLDVSLTPTWNSTISVDIEVNTTCVETQTGLVLTSQVSKFLAASPVSQTIDFKLLASNAASGGGIAVCTFTGAGLGGVLVQESSLDFNYTDGWVRARTPTGYSSVVSDTDQIVWVSPEQVPEQYIIVNISNNDGVALTPSSMWWDYHDITSQYFTITAPTVAPGDKLIVPVSFTLSGPDAPYVATPSTINFVFAALNRATVSLSPDASTGLITGQQVTLNFQFAFAVTVSAEVYVKCGVHSSFLSVYVAVPADQSLLLYNITLPSSTTDPIDTVKCTFTFAGAGAALLKADSLSFNFTQPTSSSSTGVAAESSTGGISSTAEESTSASSSSTAALSSTGDVSSTGAEFNSSTGAAISTPVYDCALCAAMGTASLPSLFLYAIALVIAVFGSRHVA